MKLLFKQRFFSWLDSYDIFDENGTRIFTVKGVLAWGHCLKIFSDDDRELGMVRERLLTFLRPRFDITIAGEAAGVLTKEFTLFRPRFTLDFRNWEIIGDWLEWNYRIISGAETVASLHKRLWQFTDTYEIDLKHPEDALSALAVALAIDAVKCGQNK